ncbi:MAG: ABC transporter ATP-binding protein [Planctomycetes bacterium]|nr:ABC transporter ATP-binding protein [Planctomycetota bacterium]
MMVTKIHALEARKLSKSFAGRVVLDEVDFEIAEAESVALTGANGAGKTTLLRCLASSLRPDGGEVRWFGQPASSNPAARRRIGVVAHESFLYPQLTLRENLIFAARMYDVVRPVDRAERLLAQSGLRTDAHCLPSRISQGMRRRLAVVRALVHDPPILLLDEPAAGLDRRGTAWLMDLLLQLRGRGRTLCFATHDDRLVGRLADRAVQIDAGRVRAVADVESRAA